jgi:polyhydroxyalkanoate synthesis regulator phasin
MPAKEGVEEMFNAIKYTEELKRAGFTPDQADTSMRVLIDVMNENFATKHDVSELSAKIDSVKNELNSKIDSSVQRLDSKIDALEYKLTIKLGTITTIAIGVTATLLKLIEIGR